MAFKIKENKCRCDYVYFDDELEFPCCHNCGRLIPKYLPQDRQDKLKIIEKANEINRIYKKCDILIAILIYLYLGIHIFTLIYVNRFNKDCLRWSAFSGDVGYYTRNVGTFEMMIIAIYFGIFFPTDFKEQKLRNRFGDLVYVKHGIQIKIIKWIICLIVEMLLVKYAHEIYRYLTYVRYYNAYTDATRIDDAWNICKYNFIILTLVAIAFDVSFVLKRKYVREIMEICKRGSYKVKI